MADPRFFLNTGPFTLDRIVEVTGAALDEASDGSRLLKDIAPLESAGPDELTFLENPKYLSALENCKAAACILRPEQVERAPKGMSLLVTSNPYKAYALAAREFYPEEAASGGVSAQAHIDSSAQLGEGCSISAGAFIGAGAEIGEGCKIAANAVIGDGVKVGDHLDLGFNASLSHCIVGDRVRIYPGARIGQDGFGFAPDPSGHVKVPQVGRVIIHDDVEIGANTCIDRGSGPDTVIGAGCWIDNLVQIGHNVELGRGCIVVSMVGISGSTKIGDFTSLAGQVGISGHINIGSGVQVAAQSGVIHDVPDGAVIGGTPALPIRDWHRQTIMLARMMKESKRTRK